MEKQQTLAHTIEYTGVGVHSGAQVSTRLLPSEPGSGIVLIRTDLDGKPEIEVNIDNVAPDALMRQTTLVSPENAAARVATVEHMLAALSGFAIDNCRIEIDAPEAPFLDGSSQELAKRINSAGVVEQDAERYAFRPEVPIVYSEGDIEIVAVPSDTLRITFFIDYTGTMIGIQAHSAIITSETFLNEIAPARTFCLLQEIEFMRAKGLIKGGSVDSALIVDGDQLANPGETLRFDNEFARHKLMDLMGDLTLLGAPLKAHVLAVKSGHRTHAEFVKKVKESIAPTI